MTLLFKKGIVAKSKERKPDGPIQESSEESYGTKQAVLPVTTATMKIRFLIMLFISILISSIPFSIYCL
jgi:hypothetical protein